MKKIIRILAGVSVLATLGLLVAIIVTGLAGSIPNGLTAAFFTFCVVNIGLYLLLVFLKNK